MDKNIAALLREDARTVHVVFEKAITEFEDLDAPERPPARKSPTQSPKVKTYTYVTHLPLVKGDSVIVEAAGRLCLAFVEHVDDEVDIEPNASTAYRWVISKLDMQAHEANMDRNKEIEKTVADAYRNNMRKSFAQQILSGVDAGKQAHLTKLIGGANG